MFKISDYKLENLNTTFKKLTYTIDYYKNEAKLTSFVISVKIDTSQSDTKLLQHIKKSVGEKLHDAFTQWKEFQTNSSNKLDLLKDKIEDYINS